MSQTITARDKALDRTGILASLLCAVHCVVGAVLTGVAGVASVFTDERTERAFVLVAVALALAAMARGYARHRSARPALLTVLGLAALAAARGVEFDVEAAEVVLSVTGAALLVAGHALNLRGLRRCCAAETPACSPQA